MTPSRPRADGGGVSLTLPHPQPLCWPGATGTPWGLRIRVTVINPPPEPLTPGNFIRPICGQISALITWIRFSHLECAKSKFPPPPTHLSKRRVLIQTDVSIPLRQRAAPQYCDVQGEEKKSQEQQQFRRQSHHPLDAAALGSLRCGRSVDSAASRCRDSNLRIRRGRGAATPLGSHFGDQKRNSDGKIIGVGCKQMVSFTVQQINC